MTYMAAMTESVPPFTDIADDFAFIDDWDERYRYLIDLGNRLPPYPDSLQTEAHRVRGCASQVWLDFRDEGETVRVRGTSDAAIVRGLIAVVLSLYDGKSPAGMLSVDPQAAFAQLDLNDHITPQRTNGLSSMVERIRAEAARKTS